MKEIKNIFDNSVIFITTENSLKIDVVANKADLWGAILIGADLREANLRVADLREANLCGADLRGADLRGADLRGANLCVADLREANLHGADLHGADLRGADLRGADLYVLQTDIWIVYIQKDFITVGCQKHSVEKWKKFNDKEISVMHTDALVWWKKWKEVIMLTHNNM